VVDPRGARIGEARRCSPDLEAGYSFDIAVEVGCSSGMELAVGCSSGMALAVGYSFDIDLLADCNSETEHLAMANHKHNPAGCCDAEVYEVHYQRNHYQGSQREDDYFGLVTNVPRDAI